jgi:hypothetical protein
MIKKINVFLLTLLALTLLVLVSPRAKAADNVIAMSYATMTVNQIMVLSSAQKAGGNFQLTVQAKDGGGRGPPNYPSDVANLTIQYYNSSGTLLATNTSNNSTTYGETTFRTYTLNAAYCASGCATVAYIKVGFTGNDGGYWAGNVGTNFMSPVLTFTPTGGSESTNLLYNPQWAVYAGYASNSGPTGWTNTTTTWGGNTHPQLYNYGATLPSTDYYATGGTTSGQAGGYPAATLCCGGSSASFNADSANTAKVTTFVNTANHGNRVYVEQIGNSNTITVNQEGSSNNYAKYVGNGSSNTIDINQTGNANTTVNYVDLAVTGNSNNVSLQQTSTGGSKGIFATVNDNSNTLSVIQKDSGNHYAAVNLSGGSKHVDITQQGSAAHMANVGLSGNSVDLSLTQSGSTQQFYSINFNCSTVGGCPKITVQQGQ